MRDNSPAARRVVAFREPARLHAQFHVAYATRNCPGTFMVPMRDSGTVGASMNRRRVGQTFLSAGLGDFLVARWTAGLESPANRQAGKPALRLGSWSQCMRKSERRLSMNRPRTARRPGAQHRGLALGRPDLCPAARPRHGLRPGTGRGPLTAARHLESQETAWPSRS